jgi:hypothetical protein
VGTREEARGGGDTEGETMEKRAGTRRYGDGEGDATARRMARGARE